MIVFRVTNRDIHLFGTMMQTGDDKTTGCGADMLGRGRQVNAGIGGQLPVQDYVQFIITFLQATVDCRYSVNRSEIIDQALCRQGTQFVIGA